MKVTIKHLSKAEKNELIWTNNDKFYPISKDGTPAFWRGELTLRKYYGKYDSIDDFKTPIPGVDFMFLSTPELITNGELFFYKKGQSAYQIGFQNEEDAEIMCSSYVEKWNHIPFWSFIEFLSNDPHHADEFLFWYAKLKRYLTKSEIQNLGF